MMTRRLLIVCWVVLTAAIAVSGDSDADREFRAKYEEFIKQAQRLNYTWEQSTSAVENLGSEFNCKVDPDYEPKALTVHELTPYDIGVVAAIGDSITAALLANANFFNFLLLTEYRGVSWSIGGDKDLTTVTTLPNILKMYNKDVVGFSVGTGNAKSVNSQLNRAVSAAVSSDMLEQAKDLVDKIREKGLVDKWKLVTLWIGGNDLCAACNDETKYSADNYVTNIEVALNYLKAELPKTFVSVVQIIDIEILADVSSLFCEFAHTFVCPCKREAKVMAKAYQDALVKLVEQYQDTDDFAVVMQPFMVGISIPKDGNGNTDMSYFAPDCFHFSQKGHKEGAVALWNNMIEEVGKKDLTWDVNGPINCPDDPPYLYTKGTKKQSIRQYAAAVDDSNQQQSAGAGAGGSAAIIAGSVVAVVVVVVVLVALTILAAFVVRGRQRLVVGESVPLVRSN